VSPPLQEIANSFEGPAVPPNLLRSRTRCPHDAYASFFQTLHVLSGAGFFVFYPNPRGSSGYGYTFTNGVTVGQWGLVDEEDFMTGIDAVLAA
jgi:dipeptidyl aminopeptidase/acylaminoacyl peptidase